MRALVVAVALPGLVLLGLVGVLILGHRMAYTPVCGAWPTPGFTSAQASPEWSSLATPPPCPAPAH